MMSRKWFSVTVLSALGLVVSSPYVLSAHREGSHPAAGQKVLRVASLNMAQEADPFKILEQWRANPDLAATDVFLLQEVMHYEGKRPSVAHLLAERMGYQVVSEPNLRGKNTDGLAILSRYPMHDFVMKQLPHADLGFRNRTRIMLAATVDSPDGPIRVYDLHLDTRINPEERLRQLQPVIDQASEEKLPTFIAGDFNTNYFHWVRNVFPLPAHQQGQAVQNAMLTRGFTTAFSDVGPTFDHFGFQLDWIFTRGLDSYDPQVAPLAFSDHHALLLKLTPHRS